MIPDNVLRALKPSLATGMTTVGWIFPDGSVVQCDIMRHRDVLPQEWRDRYDELLNYEEEYMQNVLGSEDPDEHPAMHRFDPAGDANNSLMKELDTNGYMRFGLWSNKASGTNLELYGSDNLLERHRPVLRYLVAALDVQTTTLRSYYKSRRIKV